MAVDFSDYFWGEKNEGFNVLYQNMKCGVVATKELADFLKERAKIEDENSKAQAKISKQLNTSSACGSFAPMLLALKFSTEKLSSIHNQWSQKLLNLVKDVMKYSDDLNKTHKQVKDDESTTSDAVKALQDATGMVQKTKEVYKQRCQELDKLRKSNASTKDIEKSEAKFRKAQEEYKANVDKYCSVRDDFERKMTLASKHFQEVEGSYLRQMREFVESYCQIVDNNNNQVGRVYQEFQIQITELTTENLLEQFTLAKTTGLEKPGVVEFDEEKISLKSITGPPSDISDRSAGSNEKAAVAGGQATATVDLLDISFPSEPSQPSAAVATADLDTTITNRSTPTIVQSATEDSTSLPEHSSPGRSPHAVKAGWTVSGFLKRNNKKDKKKKSTTSIVTKDGEAGEETATDDGRKSQTPTPEVDEEGYSKQPEVSTGPSDPWADFNQSNKNFDSSSDDSDDEDSKRKIKVEIKPIRADGTATPSFDELSSVIGRIELAPPPVSTKVRPKSALNDRILSGAMTLRSKTRELKNQSSSEGIKRSQSQTQINLPSQDLLGLSLHPIGPIDPKPNKTSVETAFSEAPFEADFGEKNGKSSPKQTLDTSTTSKEVQDILGGFNSEQQPPLPPKQNPSQMQRGQISNSLIALPRPPSRMGVSTARPRGSPSPAPETVRKLSRYASESSASPVSTSRSDLDAFRTPYTLSRGPSPLTLGMSDVIPLAVAFQEVCHVCFRGVDESACQVRLIGDMMISFPAGVVQVITANPNPSLLKFKIKNADLIESVVANKSLISANESMSTLESKVFEFDMKSLRDLLRKQAELNPNASYFNLDLLKYQVRAKHGAGSCPLQMVAYWKCSDTHTDLRLDYKYNGSAMNTPCPLLNLSIAVPVSGGVTNMQSQPTGTWIPESGRALWKLTELSPHNDNGVGSLRGRFQLSSGPGSQGTIAAQFNCEGTTLSGIDFELVGSGYRLSLVKRRFVSGKYICDGDASTDNRYRYAAPPSIATNNLQGPTEC